MSYTRDDAPKLNIPNQSVEIETDADAYSATVSDRNDMGDSVSHTIFIGGGEEEKLIYTSKFVKLLNSGEIVRDIRVSSS